MSFDLKLSAQQNTQNLSSQQKKLNRLIEQIEQQKIQLDMWQKAKDEIQQQTRKTLVPIYSELHNILFQQLEQLWNCLQVHEFSKADLTQLDDKIQNLASLLKNSQFLTEQQKIKVIQIGEFYQQHAEHTQAKKQKKNLHREEDYNIKSNHHIENNTQVIDEDFVEMDWNADDFDEQHQLEREQHRLNRQKEKREQAQKMADQALKTVYLKIASIIHPDREQDEQIKVEKTEMLQQVNQAYEQQDLFYLLKLQIQVELNRGTAQKGLSNEQVKFYKLALDTQKQQLDAQIAEIIESLNWNKQVKSKVQKASKPIQIADLYKKLETDCTELKQQVKWEKERLKYMGKLRGLEMLLGNGVF